jgi:hypothetical protein
VQRVNHQTERAQGSEALMRSRRARRRGLFSAVSLLVSSCVLNPQPDEPNNAGRGEDSPGGTYHSTSVGSDPDNEARGGGDSTGSSSIKPGPGGGAAASYPSAAAGVGTAGNAGTGGESALATTPLAGAAGAAGAERL